MGALDAAAGSEHVNRHDKAGGKKAHGKVSEEAEDSGAFTTAEVVKRFTRGCVGGKEPKRSCDRDRSAAHDGNDRRAGAVRIPHSGELGSCWLAGVMAEEVGRGRGAVRRGTEERIVGGPWDGRRMCRDA